MPQTFSEVQDPFLPQGPTRWPSIVGWVLFLWTLVGVGLGIWGIVNGSLAIQTYQGLPNWMVAVLRLMVVVGPLISLVGLFGGWLLRKRMRRGFTLVLTWVVASLVYTACALALQIIGSEDMQALIKRQILEALEKNGQPAQNMTPEALKVIWISQIGCGGAIGFLPPIVIGVILISGARRREVTDWPQA